MVIVMAVRTTVGWGDSPRASIPAEPGEATTVSRELSGFNEIEINGNWTVTVTRGDEWQVELSYPENFEDLVDVSVSGEQLRLDGDDPESFFGRSNANLAADIVMPALTELDVAGSSDVTLSGFEGDELAIDAAGANRITGEQGRYDELDLNVAGASDIQLRGITFTDADVDLAGAANLVLTMDGGELTGGLAGAGKVEYYGTVARESVDRRGLRFGGTGGALSVPPPSCCARCGTRTAGHEMVCALHKARPAIYSTQTTCSALIPQPSEPSAATHCIVTSRLDIIPSMEYVAPWIGIPSTPMSLAIGGRRLRTERKKSLRRWSNCWPSTVPVSGFPTLPALQVPATATCASFASSTAAVLSACFYAFDPRRTAILLIGGDKTGNQRFYRQFVPLADKLYDEHLKELKEEGLIE